jgi:hypothetical protein
MKNFACPVLYHCILVIAEYVTNKDVALDAEQHGLDMDMYWK